MTDTKSPKFILRKRRNAGEEHPPEHPPDASLPQVPEHHPTPEQLERIQTLEHELAFEEDVNTGKALVGKTLDARRQELRALAKESGYTVTNCGFFRWGTVQ